MKQDGKFWDKVSPLYDFFESVYNKKVYDGTGKAVAELLDGSEEVLECACGTGAITKYIARKCKNLIATDYSEGMLWQAIKKLKANTNVAVEKADITQLRFADESFDVVVAGNVIHLLPEPDKALKELERVVRLGGKIIIPTYINMSKASNKIAAKFLGFLGADFKRQFDLDSYKSFFEDMGYSDVEYSIVEGRMPCAIAVMVKQDSSAH